MARENTEPEENYTGVNLVRVLAPYSRDDQDFVIGVNGENFTMPQDGKYHEIPEKFAYEYLRSQRAEIKFHELQASLINDSKIV